MYSIVWPSYGAHLAGVKWNLMKRNSNVEEKETDETKQAQIEQTHEKHHDELSLPQAR